MRDAHKKVLIQLLLVFCTLNLSACFEIKEVLSINKNGSGNYSLVMDFGQSKRMFQMIMEMAKAETMIMEEVGANPLSGLDSGFKEMSLYINGLQGISKAASIRDQENFKFGLSFSFESVEDLNVALAELDASDTKTNYRRYYEYTRGRLKKGESFNLENLGKEILSEDLQKSLGGSYAKQLQDLSASVNYSIVIRTDGKIRKFTNEDAVLSQDKRELVFSKNLIELMEHNVDISNQIRFR